jgi:hypothetical protein
MSKEPIMEDNTPTEDLHEIADVKFLRMFELVKDKYELSLIPNTYVYPELRGKILWTMQADSLKELLYSITIISKILKSIVVFQDTIEAVEIREIETGKVLLRLTILDIFTGCFTRREMNSNKTN